MDFTKKSVLILVHQDGWIEAFADKSIGVKIVNVLFVESVEGEIAAERYLEKTLPQRYKEISWPNNKRASLLLRKILPSDIQRAKNDLELIKKLKSLQSKVSSPLVDVDTPVIEQGGAAV